MEELKKIVSEKAAVTDEQALKAIEAVSAYIKERVPGVIHSSLDKVLAGQDLEDSVRSKAESIGNDLKNKAEELSNELKQVFDKAFKSNK